MTFSVPVADRNACLNLVLDAMDAGAGPGTIKVYTGSKPASPDDAATGTLLVTFTCADPAWAAASGGVKVLDADPDLSAAAVATGTAGWARCEDSNGVNHGDGSVTATGGGGEFTMNTTSLTNGQTAILTSGQVAFPAA